LGRIAFESENYLLSCEHLEAARLQSPEDRDIQRDLGRTLSRMARHDEALDLLEECHHQMPDAVAPLLALG
jgi:tetratricopeptide (TPR) repeat protein